MDPAFPVLRWAAIAWLLVWFPAYWRVWGWRNFLHICDIGIMLTCAGLWRGDPLLLSSQAVGTLVFDLCWCIDVTGRLLWGRHVLHGTEYMWNRDRPLWVRLLSLHHVAMPVVLLYALSRVGYDPRGWLLQTAITLPVLVAGRVLGPGRNLNFVEREPFSYRPVGPAPVHVALACLAAILIYWPTHRLLLRIFENLRI